MLTASGKGINAASTGFPSATWRLRGHRSSWETANTRAGYVDSASGAAPAEETSCAMED
jgi:hypothetical protein